MKTTKRRKARGLPLIVLGIILVLWGLGMSGQNLYEDRQAGITAGMTFRTLSEYVPEERLHLAPTPVTEEEIVVIANRVLPRLNVEGRDYVGMLQIPAISLELPVQTPYAFESLKTAPCLYSGDPYHNNMVICAHNYRSHFGRIKELQEGDDLLFIALDGELYRYRLIEQEILDPKAVEEMLEPLGWDLILFTCTVGGEYRVAARFSRIP